MEHANGHVDCATQAGVATVTFGHPKGNSLPANVLADLASAVESAGRDPQARVIVLRSTGDGPFCGGASFSELKAVKDAEGGQRFFMGFANLILAMIRAPKFVLSRVHGKAVGGGVGVVAASDYAMATRSASVRLSELAVGIGPFIIGPVVERRVGPGPFAAMSVDADWRDAEWAERHGLYASLHESVADLDAALEQRAATLADSNPEAMAELKSIFWKGTESWPELLPQRAGISGRLVLSGFTRRALGIS